MDRIPHLGRGAEGWQRWRRAQREWNIAARRHNMVMSSKEREAGVAQGMLSFNCMPCDTAATPDKSAFIGRAELKRLAAMFSDRCARSRRSRTVAGWE